MKQIRSKISLFGFTKGKEYNVIFTLEHPMAKYDWYTVRDDNDTIVDVYGENFELIECKVIEEKLDKDVIQADIRNRLNPINNLIAMIENWNLSNQLSSDAMIKIFKAELEQCKVEVSKLSNYFKENNEKTN